MAECGDWTFDMEMDPQSQCAAFVSILRLRRPERFECDSIFRRRSDVRRRELSGVEWISVVVHTGSVTVPCRLGGDLVTT